MPGDDTLGISLALTTSFLSGLAYALQKKGHVQRNAAAAAKSVNGGPPVKLPPIWMNLTWLTGFASMLAAAVLAVTCYTMLDQSKQASIGAVTIVWNVLLSGIILGERVTVLDAMCTCLILSGTVLAVVDSEATSHTFTFAEILDLLQDDFVYVYSGILLTYFTTAVTFIELSVYRGRHTWSSLQKTMLSLIAPVTGGMCNGIVAYAIKAETTLFSTNEWGVQLKAPWWYIYVFMSIAVVLLQVRYLNAGLQHFNALHVVPIYQSFVIFSNALSGIVYYHDMRTAPAKNLALFAMGGFMCMLGLGLLRLKADVAGAGGHGDDHHHGAKEVASVRTSRASSYEADVSAMSGSVPVAGPLDDVPADERPLLAAHHEAKASADIAARGRIWYDVEIKDVFWSVVNRVRGDASSDAAVPAPAKDAAVSHA